jgi:ZIP family zinc transporter
VLNNVALAFLLTALAGVSTGVGSVIAFFSKTTNTRFLSLSLGFSGGVMIYVSMVEIFFKARDALAAPFGLKTGTLFTIAGFFGGMLLIGVIDRLIPSAQNPHEAPSASDMAALHSTLPKQKLMRTGMFTALAIAIHNFPEGLATFVSALQEPGLAIPIVVAIAIHNIPEGIAVSVPIYYATGNKKRLLYIRLRPDFPNPLAR